MTTTTPKAVKIPRRRSAKVNPAHPVYEIDLWLCGTEPPIWRTLAVSNDFTLDDLHILIQIAMDWENYHIHQFETKSGTRYESEPETFAVDSMWKTIMDGTQESKEESEVALVDLFEDLKETLLYLYDFGDNWDHGLKIIRTHEKRSEFEHLPCLLDGARAAPPEDCGGVWGYENNLEILQNPDPKNEDHEMIIEWMGGVNYDPEAFDPDAINRSIQSVFAPPPKHSGTKGRKPGIKQKKRKSR